MNIVALLLLKAGAGLTMIVFGIHQFLHPSEWFDYIPAVIRKRQNIQPEKIMRMHAIGNFVFGLFLISGFHPLIAAWIAFIWWLSLLPFAFFNKWSIGLRDVSITISILAYIFLLS